MLFLDEVEKISKMDSEEQLERLHDKLIELDDETGNNWVLGDYDYFDMVYKTCEKYKMLHVLMELYFDVNGNYFKSKTDEYKEVINERMELLGKEQGKETDCTEIKGG